jgi:hypothetical protein
MNKSLQLSLRRAAYTIFFSDYYSAREGNGCDANAFLFWWIIRWRVINKYIAGGDIDRAKFSLAI